MANESRMHRDGRRCPKCLIAIGLLLMVFSKRSAGQYEPPADYYTTATGTGSVLKDQLHLIISDNYWTSLTGPGSSFVPNGSGHRVISYDSCRQSLPVVDRDPTDPGNVILAYNGASVQGPWSSGGVIWNREHRWPKSWGLGTSGPDYSDMFQLTPCNPSINSMRGNYSYGAVNSSGSYGVDYPYWYPGDNDVAGEPDFGNDTGDCARAFFYMAVRYDGGEYNTVDLELRSGTYGQVGSIHYGGDLAAVLKWHYLDVPSEYEQRRNHTIFSNTLNPHYYQGNRNPFIDHPEWVWSIFGGGNNDSSIHVGSDQSSDGTSSIHVDFGSVSVGDPIPPAQIVTIHKSGLSPTYFSINATGSAASSTTARQHAFTTGTVSIDIPVTLAPDTTSTAGEKTGTIVIDNLDISSAGPGTGAQDGDDIIHVTISVGGCSDPAVDVDDDGDVDQTDFATFQRCLTGIDDPDGTYDAALCSCLDTDHDADIDADDFDVFEGCLSGANQSADPGCAGS